MLFGRSPRDPLLLLDNYAVWPGNGQEFEVLNIALEAGFKKHLPGQVFDSLKNQAKLASAQAEVYDELGGLFAAQTLLGPSEDQKDQVSESFSWLDHPDNVRLLLASYALRGKLNQADLDLIELEEALAFVAGNDTRKIDEIVDPAREGARVLHAKLDDCAKDFDKQFRESIDALFLRFLGDYSRYRTHLFNPISERLAAYGAVKVFIEGDAVILGTYEYANAPDEWFSVSRACGIAKEMLDIVASKNAHSRQTGLPLLEIGIGICYSDDKPLFLFDEDHPIMISSAIGNADRMSSCSWRLRGNFEPGDFHVGVFVMADDDKDKGEKGQALVRYNVNGIVIDDAAFVKLEKEVHFKRLKANSGGVEETFYVGQYPDVQGKQRDLVVRQGRVGRLKGDVIEIDPDSDQIYFEVLSNTRFANQIVDLAKKKS